jgi:hypothetical protein
MADLFVFTLSQSLSEKMLRQIERLYRALPLGSVVDGQVMIVHGGISNKTDLRELWTLDRFKVQEKNQGLHGF